VRKGSGSIRDTTDFLARIITKGTGKTAWNIAAIPQLPERIAEAAVRRGRVCLHPVDRRDADNVYEVGTDTFVVRDGKIVMQSFTGKIKPNG
jgi:hypothetical protein